MKPGRLANRGLGEDQRPTLGLNWLWDESGQDVIEYALLAAIVGIASIGTWELVVRAVFDAYTGTNNGVQNLCPMPNPDGTAAVQSCQP